MSNLYLDRKGPWWVLAAGTTNTNGRGGPWGPIPVDGANRRVIGIEAGNGGDNQEPWPEVMQDSYVRGVAALADRYDIDSNNVISHYEWSPGGEDRSSGTESIREDQHFGTWDMNKFRAEVNDARKNRSTVDARSSSAEPPTTTCMSSSPVMRGGRSPRRPWVIRGRTGRRWPTRTGARTAC